MNIEVNILANIQGISERALSNEKLALHANENAELMKSINLNHIISTQASSYTSRAVIK